MPGLNDCLKQAFKFSRKDGLPQIPPPTVESEPRSRLLAAAGPVFAARGYDRSTLREISSAADVNVAAVAYYFGDKMGLYREVVQQIRDARERRFPVPNNTAQFDPPVALARLVRTMLSRMLVCDETGWETQLLMREMNNPTVVLSELVNDFFRPLFQQLTDTIRRMFEPCAVESPAEQEIAEHTVEQLALSVVGQCVYYRVGREVVDILIPKDRREEHFDINSLSLHITAVAMAATQNAQIVHEKLRLEPLVDNAVETPGQGVESEHPINSDSSTQI